jgi:hydroxybutyrate-dimer hydrolase
MQPYLLAAMDDMYRHLRYGAPLAPSQVVRSTPRRLAATGVAEALTATHLGAWHARPPATERIEMRGSVLRVPE